VPAFALSSVAALLPTTPASALNPVQVYVQEKCPKSADAASRCAEKFNQALRKECGPSKTTDKYRSCVRNYVKEQGVELRSNSCWKTCEPKKEDGDGSGGVLQDPVAGNDCGGVKTAIIKCDQNNSGSNVENNGIWGLLLIAINIMTAGVGVLAVGGIVYGAILYTTAEDKADQVKKAIDIITNVVIGLVAFALMWAGLNFLIPGGVFS